MNDSNEIQEEKKKPFCSKCRNHCVLSPLKGHKRRCLYKDCQCPKCQLVEARRDISKRQIALRRLQIEEENYGSSTSTESEVSSEGLRGSASIASSMINYNYGPPPPAPPQAQSANYCHQPYSRNWYPNPGPTPFTQNQYPRYPSYTGIPSSTHYPYLNTSGQSHRPYQSVIREANQIVPRYQPDDANSIGNSQNSSEDDETITIELNEGSDNKASVQLALI